MDRYGWEEERSFYLPYGLDGTLNLTVIHLMMNASEAKNSHYPETALIIELGNLHGCEKNLDLKVSKSRAQI